jgi:ribosomal protein L11 methyltransferase
MQNYLKFEFPQASGPKQEELLAELAEWPFEGFEEKNDCLIAFVPEDEFSPELREYISEICHLNNWASIKAEIIAPQNWNENWEKQYEPVVVNNFCIIRATFHQKREDILHDIVITPKMSFGTGHHATTNMMVQAMEKLNFNKKLVLDFGCGTSVLAILAAKLGALHCDAVDIDDWAYENSLENIVLNNVEQTISVYKGDLDAVPTKKYDIILANINRHIIERSLEDIASLTNSGGSLLCSGFLDTDISLIRTEALRTGFELKDEIAIERWRCLHFTKI